MFANTSHPLTTLITRILLTFSLFLALHAPLHAQLLRDGLAASVNSEVITQLEVRKTMAESERLLRQTYSSPEQEPELMARLHEAQLSTLKSLIERQLIIQDFKKDQGVIPELVVTQRVQSVIRSDYGNDRLTFIKSLNERGVTMEDFRKEISETMIVGFMRYHNVSQTVLVSPYQIQKFYDEHKNLFLRPEQAKVSTLILRKPVFTSKRTGPDGKEQEYDPQLELAQDLVKRIRKGEDFAQLARQYSEGSNKDSGGMLGWVTQTGAQGLREDLWPVVMKLNPGEVSDVVPTSDGYYYIVQVSDKQHEAMAPMEQVREDIKSAVINEETEQRYETWMDGLRAKAFIKMY